MRSLLIGLLALAAPAIYASETCTVKIVPLQSESSLTTRAIAVAEEKISEKGYQVVYGEDTALYTLQIKANFAVNTLDQWGYSVGEATLSKGVLVIAKRSYNEGNMASYFLGIGKKAKALNRLSNAIEALPSCAQL